MSLPASAESTHSTASHAASAKTSKTTGRTSHADRVEDRIAELHSKLRITREQEAQWNNVAQVMRDNAKALDSIAEERMANKDKMTAVDDLNAYSRMSDARAEGLKKLVPAFQALYDSMSDAQKKVADTSFHGNSRMAARSSSKSHS